MADLLTYDIQTAIPEILSAFFSDDMVEKILDDLAAMAQAKWVNLAKQRLGSSKQAYIWGINIGGIEAEPGARTLSLAGWLPNAVEQGLSAFDLRQTLLGPNAKNRKPSFIYVKGQPKVRSGEWYANVPFRHGTPASQGQAGPPMMSPYRQKTSPGAPGRIEGFMGAEEAASWAKDLYTAAKKLRRGERLTPSEHGMPKLAPHHSTNIYENMQKIAAPGHTQYMTWRTISTRSARGWIHPGIEGRHLAQEVISHVREQAPKFVQRVFQQALKAGGEGTIG
jgi:hypothetical protein